MPRVVTNELLNVRQPARQRRTVIATIAEEAKAGLMQRLNLCPLLLVPCGRRFERAAHPVQRATAVRTLGLLWSTGNLEALATGKAGISRVPCGVALA